MKSSMTLEQLKFIERYAATMNDEPITYFTEEGVVALKTNKGEILEIVSRDFAEEEGFEIAYQESYNGKVSDIVMIYIVKNYNSSYEDGLYKELFKKINGISVRAESLKEEMEGVVKELSTMLPTEDLDVKKMLQICESEAIQKLNPHCLIQFYGDRYDLLKVGYQIPEDTRYCCEEINDHFDLRMHTVDDEGNGNVLELDIEVDADYVITSIKANWY